MGDGLGIDGSADLFRLWEGCRGTGGTEGVKDFRKSAGNSV